MAAIALAAGAFVHFWPHGRAVVAAGFCAVLVVLVSIDIERRVIPNRIVLPAALIVLLANIVAAPDRTREWILAAIIPAAGALVISLATRGGIGMGDVKLLVLLGAGLGWAIVEGLVVAMALTLVASIVILARHGLGARKETIPFSPFLALGAIVVLFFS